MDRKKIIMTEIDKFLKNNPNFDSLCMRNVLFLEVSEYLDNFNDFVKSVFSDEGETLANLVLSNIDLTNEIQLADNVRFYLENAILHSLTNSKFPNS